MTAQRSVGHANQRGNSKDRRARKLFLLSKFGDGDYAPCSDCNVTVDYETMVVDRIIPGRDGGRYVRDNIKIHCLPCSCHQGYEMGIHAALQAV